MDAESSSICLSNIEKPKQYLSDIITKTEYSIFTSKIITQKWLIDTPTGSGKTTFIENLANMIGIFSGSVLIFSNRIALKKQIEERPHKINFKCMNYQELCTDYNISKLNSFTIIVLDEIHYLFNDSIFNADTYKHFEIIKNLNATLIFMTATPKKIIEYFKEINYYYRVLEKTIDKTNNSMKKITFINNIQDIPKIVNENEGKFLIFNNNISENIKLKEQIKDCEITMSKDNENEEQKKHNSTEEIDNIIKYYKFKSKALITTSVLDNGISIKDDELINIILILFDPVQLNQSLGRVRVDGEHKLNLWLFDLPSKTQINKRIDKLNSILLQLDEFDLNGISNIKEDYKKYFKKDYNTKQWYYNKFIRSQIKTNLEVYQMFKSFTKEEYRKWICNELNIGKNVEIITTESIFEKEISSFIGIKMFKEEQIKLQEIVKEYIIETKQVSKFKTLGINKLNELFLQWNYKIDNLKCWEKNKNRGKTYWILNKII